MHDGVIVIIEVSSGVIIILKVEVAMLSFSDILVNDLDVLVPVWSGMFMVETQGMHDLMHSSTRATETITVLITGSLQW